MCVWRLENFDGLALRYLRTWDMHGAHARKPAVCLTYVAPRPFSSSCNPFQGFVKSLLDVPDNLERAASVVPSEALKVCVSVCVCMWGLARGPGEEPSSCLGHAGDTRG